MLRADVTEVAQTSYEPTERDVLWLLRAVAAEGPPHEQVARALVSGFLWARSRLEAGYDLAEWVRRYSQPVNPRWLPGGDLYDARMRTAQSEGKRALVERYQRQAKRRERAQRRTDFPAHVRRAVEQALTEGTNAPVTDFAAWWIEPSRNRTPITPAVPNENRFFTRDESWTGYRGGDPKWAAELVARVTGSAPSSGGAGGLAIVLIALGVAWWRLHG